MDKQLYLAVHSHRFGVDTTPFWFVPSAALPFPDPDRYARSRFNVLGGDTKMIGPINLDDLVTWTATQIGGRSRPTPPGPELVRPEVLHSWLLHAHAKGKVTAGEALDLFYTTPDDEVLKVLTPWLGETSNRQVLVDLNHGLYVLIGRHGEGRHREFVI